jgi:hypothetical protein
MKKTRKINFTGLFLLLLYVFSNSPVILFHHHDNHIVAYDKADQCEKVIYYSSKSDGCHHKEHISKASEKCSLCDHHSLSVYTVFTPSFFYLKPLKAGEYILFHESIQLITFSETSNRGPPTV